MKTPSLVEFEALSAAAEQALSPFSNAEQFARFLPIAEMLATSTIVHECYRNNPANCLLAIEVSHRTGMPVISVTQNLHIIEGKPAWSGKYVIATLNTCGRFDPIQFEFQGEPGSYEYGCRAFTKRTGNDQRVDGEWVTWKMVCDAGWLYEGSPWHSMRDLMFQYRAACFFGNLRAPDVLLGLPTVEEALDIQRGGKAKHGAAQQTEVSLVAAAIAPTTKLSQFAAALRDVAPPPAPVAPLPKPQEPVVQPKVQATSEVVKESESTQPAPAKRARAKKQPASSAPAATAPSLWDNVEQAPVGLVESTTVVPEDTKAEAVADDAVQVTTSAEAIAHAAEPAPPSVTRAPAGGANDSGMSSVQETLDLAVVRELCVRACTAADVAAVAEQLALVTDADRSAAEREVVETAVTFVAEETTHDGMATLMKVFNHISEKSLKDLYRITYNGRAKVLSGLQ